MKVKNVMSKTVAFCIPSEPSKRAAELMKQHDVGSIPIVDHYETRTLLGTVTDRDLCLKIIAEGKSGTTPLALVMTKSPVTCHAEDSLDSCEALMQKHQIRRIPVVDPEGKCIGIVAQADIVLRDDAPHVRKTVGAISQPHHHAHHHQEAVLA